VRKWIGEKYPADLPSEPVEYSVEKKAQDAHEAIRPTYVSYTPDYLKEHLTRDQLRLYSIIWERFVSSQMNSAKSRTASIDIKSGDAIFRVSATRVFEKGFYKVIKTLMSKEEKETPLPEMKVGEPSTAAPSAPSSTLPRGPRVSPTPRSSRPSRKGHGRPSTYAPIISVLLDRYYVTASNKQLVPTQLGRMINDILVEHFPAVVDVNSPPRSRESSTRSRRVGSSGPR
jgi:DNA topoisomerase-1